MGSGEGEPGLLPYLDIPFQHASPRILKLMKRPAAAEKTLDRILNWRKINPDISLRSTFVVGFPGETEAEFEELLQFLREAQLDRVGCFAYSPVEGAAANALPDPVPEEVKQERQARFMEVQEEISEARLTNKVGRTMRVLIDELGEMEDGTPVALARSYADAPDIDGVVQIDTPGDIKPGDFMEVRIIDSDSHDLWAEPINPA
jgi:ribosomal protein S12 methylthiotransferase